MERWFQVGAQERKAQTDADGPQFSLVADHDHRPSFSAEFKAGDGGKMGGAVSMTRWVNTRGEKGPWSEVTTATQGNRIIQIHRQKALMLQRY